jgi:serine/threonine-protein kinase
MGVLRRICDDTPRDLLEVNADVPVWLAAIIDRLLAKSREDRFQTADEVARLLEQCLAHLQHPTSIALPTAVTLLAARRRPDKSTSRRAVWPFLVVAVLLGLFSWSAWKRPPGLEQGSSGGPAVAPTGTETSGSRPASRTSSGDLMRWNDGIERTCSEIEAELRMLEQDAHPSW